MRFPPRGTYSYKREKGISDYSEYLQTANHVWKKWQTRHVTKPVDTYNGPSDEKSINSRSLQRTITLFSGLTSEDGARTLHRGQQLCKQSPKSNRSAFPTLTFSGLGVNTRLHSTLHTRTYTHTGTHMHKIPLLQHNLGAIHQIRHWIN